MYTDNICKLHFILLSCVVIVILVNTRKCSGQCLFALNGDLSKNAPLFLRQYHDSYKMVPPFGQYIKFNTSEELYLACTGAGNNFQPLENDFPRSATMIKATCISGKQIQIQELNNTFYDISDMNCRYSILGDISYPNIPCANNIGHIIKIGFNIKNIDGVFGNDKWVDLYKICFNSETASTIYTVHSLPIIINRESMKQRPEFRSEGFPQSVSPRSCYIKKNQSLTFQNICGMVDRLTETGNCITRGHLVRSGDFYLAAQRRATFYFVNMVPQWQSINGGNWETIERLVEAINSRRNITIYTGVHDILTRKHNNGSYVRIYLSSDNKIEVPKWTWKIVLSSHKNGTCGIGFVTLNDPFVERENEIQPICRNICDEAGFEVENNGLFKNLTRGYSYCCTVDSLIKVVPNIPNITVDYLMRKEFNPALYITNLTESEIEGNGIDLG